MYLSESLGKVSPGSLMPAYNNFESSTSLSLLPDKMGSSDGKRRDAKGPTRSSASAVDGKRDKHLKSQDGELLNVGRVHLAF